MHRIIWLLTVSAMGVYAADVNEDLLAASRRGDLAAVKQLVEKGAAVEAKTPYGQTALYLAAMNGHESVVRYLLDKGASADVKDTFYKASMLDFVLQRKHFGVAEMLIRKGAGNPDDVIESAVQSGNAGLMQALLESAKPSQTALDKAYETALQLKSEQLSALLKKAGAREPAPAFIVDLKTIEGYAGTYKSDQIPLEIKAFVKDGGLYLQASGQSAFPLKAKSATLFEFAQAQIQVEFDTPSSFTLKQGPGSYKFKKAATQ